MQGEPHYFSYEAGPKQSLKVIPEKILTNVSLESNTVNQCFAENAGQESASPS